MMSSKKPDISKRPTPELNKGVTLYPYQTEAIEWMQKRESAALKQNHGITGGMLCLKMGLGKTLTALQHSLWSQSTNAEQFPTLIIASKTVMYEWKNQGVEKFYSNINALYFHKDFLGKYIKEISAAEIVGYNVVITTYDQCLSASRLHAAHNLVCEYGQEGLLKDKVIAIHNRKRPPYRPTKKGTINLYSIPWQRIVTDESQRFANPKTYIYKAMMALYGEHRWCLTGTPVRNYATDIWSQFRFCGYNTITTARLWRRWYFKEQGLIDYIFESNYDKAKVKMPARKEHRHLVEMDPQQLGAYKAILMQTQDLFEMMLQKFISYAEVLAMFIRLRQTCIAPYLLVAKKAKHSNKIKNNIDVMVEKNKLDAWITDQDGPAGIDSPKVKKIIEVIENIPKGEKIILFSMFVTCLETIEHAIKTDLPNHSHEFLDGSTSGQERVDILTNFKEDPEVTILLCHYKVGGEGLNLTEANHVICIEPWWSPAVHEQGIARAWRRGQKKPVHVHWVITDKSLEIPILDMCENKKKLANYFLQDSEYEPKSSGLTKWEMQKLLGEAANM